MTSLSLANGSCSNWTFQFKHDQLSRSGAQVARRILLAAAIPFNRLPDFLWVGRDLKNRPDSGQKSLIQENWLG